MAYLSVDHCQRLDSDNILSLWAFLTLGDDELYALAFSQGFETGAGNSAVVSENIGAGLLFDKTKTFGFVEPFNGASSCIRHGYISCKKIIIKMCLQEACVAGNTNDDFKTTGRRTTGIQRNGGYKNAAFFLAAATV